MAVDIDALTEDLKTLRKGLGVQDPKISTKVGHALAQVCGVAANDSPAMVTKKVCTRLELLLDRLPLAQRDLGRATLGYGGTATDPYTKRLKALGDAIDRDIRTMQRRADDLIRRIAELACLEAATPVVRRDPPWHTTWLQVILLVDQPAVEVLETRRIVSHRSNLTEIEHSMSVLPVDGLTHPLDLAAFGVEVLGGGAVGNLRKVASNRIAFQLRPPRTLDLHDTHEFVLRVRLPYISPFYVCTPAHPCERFDLRARFGLPRPPRIWRIEGEFAIEANDPLPARTLLGTDAAGEVRAVFEHLEAARSYGIGWQPNAD